MTNGPHGLRTARYALVLRHPVDRLIWMRRAADAWTLPSTTAAAKAFRDVEGLDRAFERVLGCGVTVLRYLRYALAADTRTLDVILEAEVAVDATDAADATDATDATDAMGGEPRIAGGAWVPIERLSAVRITPDADGAAVASWLADRSKNDEGRDETDGAPSAMRLTPDADGAAVSSWLADRSKDDEGRDDTDCALSAVRLTPGVDGAAVASRLADRSNRSKDVDGPDDQDDDGAAPPWWMRPGCHAQATRDVSAAIAARGWRLQGPLRLLRTSALGALCRAATSGGDVYLKTLPASATHEIAISKLLADRFPGRVPEVIASDDARGWLLLAGVDGEALPRSSESAESAHYHDALRRLAAIQIASVAQLDAFRAVGVPEQGLDRLARALTSEIPDDLLPAARDGGLLTPPAIESLRQLMPALRGACESLAVMVAPAALEHGDCHPHNVIVGRDGCVLLDWSECSISHPWFSAVAFLAYLDRLRPDLRRLRPSLRDAYLACWAAYGDYATLARAWTLAEPLAAVHYALSQHRALRRMRTLPAWERDEIAAGLRAALTALLGGARATQGARALV
jgi:Phosphotransferase enzyme family